jgi:hypothetical protein
MRYFELAAMIAKMTEVEQRQHVAIADLNLGEFYWAQSNLSTVLQCGLNPIWTEGVDKGQIVIIVK